MGLSRPGVESTLFRARKRLTEEYDELVSGQRCLRIQSIIAAAGERRARRARHAPPRAPRLALPAVPPQAIAAGLDAASLARKPAPPRDREQRRRLPAAPGLPARALLARQRADGAGLRADGRRVVEGRGGRRDAARRGRRRGRRPADRRRGAGRRARRSRRPRRAPSGSRRLPPAGARAAPARSASRTKLRQDHSRAGSRTRRRATRPRGARARRRRAPRRVAAARDLPDDAGVRRTGGSGYRSIERRPQAQRHRQRRAEADRGHCPGRPSRRPTRSTRAVRDTGQAVTNTVTGLRTPWAEPSPGRDRRSAARPARCGGAVGGATGAAGGAVGGRRSTAPRAARSAAPRARWARRPWSAARRVRLEAAVEDTTGRSERCGRRCDGQPARPRRLTSRGRAV